MSSEWIPTTLGEICSKQRGAIQTGPFGSQLHTSDYKETGIPVVMPTNIGEGGIATDGIARIDRLDVERLQQHKLQLNDIVFSRRGDVTKNALVRHREVGWLCGTGCLKVRLGEESVANARFISYYLRLPETKEWLIRHAVGATMPNLNTGILAAVPVTLPPLKIQLEIAVILGALDDRITLLRETNSTLEAIAQALFKSWFVDFDPVRAKMEGRTPEGIDEATAALFPDGFEASELGEVPRGWRVMPFLDACDMQGGAQPPASQFVDTPIDGYVRLLQIRDFSSDAHKTYVPIEKKLKLATEDDVLIGRYGSASGDKAKDSLGRVCRGLAGAYNVALMKLAPIEIGREFALQLVDDPRFYQYLQGVSSKAVQSGFSKKELGQYKVVVPPAPLTKLYEQFGEAVWQRSKELRSQAQTLSTLRDALLPRLISGQLRIPNAEMDAMTA